MKLLMMVLVISFMGSNSQAKQYCGHVNKVAVSYEIYPDIRIVMYNKNWKEKFITIQDAKITEQMALIIAKTSKKFSDYEGSKKYNFNWYYKENKEKYFVCIESYDRIKAVGTSGVNRSYLETAVGITSVRKNNKDINSKKLIQKITYTSKKNQLLCFKYEPPIDLFGPKASEGCFYYEDLCFTGNAYKLAEEINNGLVWTGDEHSLYDVKASKNEITMSIFDAFSFSDSGATESEREDFTEEVSIPHCKTRL